MKTSIATLSLLLVSNLLYTQNISDIELVLQKTISKPETKEYTEFVKEKNSISDYLFSGMFLFYKSFISSQDGSRCTFHPSCSEYGIMCVQEYGLFKGVLKTSDRLLRCNGFSPENYQFIPEENLLYDPL